MTMPSQNRGRIRLTWNQARKRTSAFARHRRLSRDDHGRWTFLSGSGEIAFSVLLVFGLGARFAALGLLFIILIVELTVPDGWPIHITWAAMALAIMAYGPGRLSLDHLLERVEGLSR